MKMIEGTYYSVTEKGIVTNISTGTELKYAVNGGGYPYATLVINGIKYNKMIHRLVAVAFIPNEENKPQVNHKDGNKLNFFVDNLE